MSVLDIVVVSILGLCTLIGLWKGFLRTLLSLFSNFVSLVIAVILAKPTSKLLESWFGLSSKLGSQIGNAISSSLPQEVNAEWTKDQIYENIHGSGLFKALIKPFISDGGYESTAALQLSLGEKLGALALIVISAIILFFLIKFGIFLLGKLFDAITKGHAISGLDRVLGAVMGLIKGAFIVFVGLSVIYTLSSLPFISSWFDPMIAKSPVSSTLYKYIQELYTFIVNKVDIAGTISGWIGK